MILHLLRNSADISGLARDWGSCGVWGNTGDWCTASTSPHTHREPRLELLKSSVDSGAVPLELIAHCFLGYLTTYLAINSRYGGQAAGNHGQ
jgi:hypothetical protein